MNRWPLLCLGLWVACSDPVPAPGNAAAVSASIPDQDILLHVAAGAEEVEFGAAFPLTVVRIWNRDLDPEPWSDEALSPLVPKLANFTTRENRGHIEETRIYDAYAFGRGDVLVPALVFQATNSRGEVRVAHSEEFTLRVTSALGEEDPGRAELARGPFPAPFPWLYWSSLAAALLAGFGLVSWYSRWRAHSPTPAPTILPHERALQMLQRLRERQPEGAEEAKSFCVDASSLLRTYVEHRFTVFVQGLTTEEFLSAPRVMEVLQPSHRETLREFLELCDLAKFARHVPGQAARALLLSAAERLVRETSSEQEDLESGSGP